MDDVYMDSPVSEKDFELYEKLIADIGKTIEDAVNNDGLSLLLVFPALVSCICDVLGNIEVKNVRVTSTKLSPCFLMPSRN